MHVLGLYVHILMSVILLERLEGTFLMHRLEFGAQKVTVTCF